ncbi:hypothetical protein BDB01DRAFT_800542 [Pilobolus umbonatus]|nr:hypothetical protein BDB01DRAFT_800542 [Pilobolus umbonatus]
MTQQTQFTINRAPASIRKLAHIIKDPIVFTSVVSVTIGLLGISTWYYYYHNKHKHGSPVLDPHIVKQFKLIEIRPLTHNAHIYRFALPCKDDILGLHIGQHITLVANINGKEVSRSYTPITTDEDRGFFELLIKAYSHGTLTPHIASMKVGDTIGVRGPKGTFAYTSNMVKHMVMIAGGTGITPMYQIIKDILRNPEDKTSITLIFGNVTQDDILLEKELHELSTEHVDQFSVYHVLNSPPQEWTQGTGFVTKEILQEKLPAPSPDTKILVCGPSPFVVSVTKSTTELGYEAPRTVSKLTDQVFKF